MTAQANPNIPYGYCHCGCGKKTRVHRGKPNRFIQNHSINLAVSVHKIHGEYQTKLHSVWNSMKQRCSNPNSPGYKYYGGRGIKVCERWQTSFIAFRDDMGLRPQGTTIERVNNDGNYEPSNCRWATRIEQMNNSRKTRKLVWQGKVYSIRNLARYLGMDEKCVQSRLRRGWSIEDVVSTKAISNEEALIYARERLAAVRGR